MTMITTANGHNVMTPYLGRLVMVRDMAPEIKLFQVELLNGGAEHFVRCIQAVRQHSPQTKIEILVPDFRGRMERALEIFRQSPPDVFNHNLETVPSLYRKVRPGSDYAWSLDLLQHFKALHPDVPTKSGLMLGVGETIEEVYEPYLVQEGFLERTPRGREVTDLARQHFGRHRPTDQTRLL